MENWSTTIDNDQLGEDRSTLQRVNKEIKETFHSNLDEVLQDYIIEKITDMRDAEQYIQVASVYDFVEYLKERM